MFIIVHCSVQCDVLCTIQHTVQYTVQGCSGPAQPGRHMEIAGGGSWLAPTTVGQVQVPSCLLRAGGQGQEQGAKELVLEMAVRCYSRGLALQPEGAGFWHEVRQL